MSDPIVLRSDAIKQLKDDLIAGGSGSGSSDNVVDNVSSLASSVTSSQSSINTMRNDIANLKTAISTLKAQMVALVENNNLTLEQMEEITVPEPDAPVINPWRLAILGSRHIFSPASFNPNQTLLSLYILNLLDVYISAHTTPSRESVVFQVLSSSHHIL